MTGFHGTTVLAVRRGAQVAMGGDGQVTLGNTVVKGNARKVQRRYQQRVLTGFAGGTHTHPMPHRVAESTHTPYATQSGREYILTLHHTEWQRAHTHPYSTESGKEKLFRDRVDEGDTHAMFQTQRQLQIHEKR